MVNILPKVPSFGERIGASLGAGLGAGMSKAADFATQLGLEEAKGQREKNLFSQMLGNGSEGYGGEEPSYSKNIAEEAYFAEKYPKASKLIQANREKKEAFQGAKDSLNWLDKNIMYSGTFGVSPEWGGLEAQGIGLGLKDETGKQLSNQEIKSIREGITNTGLWVTDKIFTHFNKGTLNKAKWESLKEDLAPRADLPPKVNRARIDGLKRILGLPSDAPRKIVDKVIDGEVKAQQKIEKSFKKSKGKPLTGAVIDHYLKEAGDDVEKAEELAREAGYTW